MIASSLREAPATKPCGCRTARDRHVSSAICSRAIHPAAAATARPATRVPEQYAQAHFDLLPIHEKLRGRDFPTTRNYPRVTMIQVHDVFMKRADVPAFESRFRPRG
jgi:hypothetical protein